MPQESTGPSAAETHGANASAPGAAAGYLFQFERALHLLANAQTYETEIGIETVDDLAVRDDAEVLLLEQDKHTVSGKQLSDRSFALWRTLGVWSQSDHQKAALCIVTNAALDGPLVSALATPIATSADVPARVALLRSAASPAKVPGKRRAPTATPLKVEMERVTNLSDDDLGALLSRVSILRTQTEGVSSRVQLAARLGVPSNYDSEFVITHLVGWLVRASLEAWRHQKQAWFSKAQCLKVCDSALHRAGRRRILPRPSREVEVTAEDRDRTVGCVFVEHLTRTNAPADDIDQAIDHFIQFGIEKHRLVDEGDVPPSEWAERADRLIARWRNIARQTVREMPSSPEDVVGIRILERTTYDHRERIFGEECDELYMTSGHYHRLADVDQVWWKPSKGSGGAN